MLQVALVLGVYASAARTVTCPTEPIRQEQWFLRPLDSPSAPRRADFGAEVIGLSLSQNGPPPKTVQHELEVAASRRGFLVFRNQVLAGDSLVRAWAGELANRHVTHEKAVHEDILRLSNRPEHGIGRVGPQWHADGAFERRVFSHVIFHAQTMPQDGGGGTELADLAAAYSSLSASQQAEWAQLATVNAFSGAVHPVVHKHPLSGRHVLFAHLGQTGAVLRWRTDRHSTGAEGGISCSWQTLSQWNLSTFGGGVFPQQLDAMDPRTDTVWAERCHSQFDVLTEQEVRQLLLDYNKLLDTHSIRFDYETTRGTQQDGGDVLLLDNLAVAHRAAHSAHNMNASLRVLHRITFAGRQTLDPPESSGLPPFLYIWGNNPLRRLTGAEHGLWQPSDYYGVGYRWDETLDFYN